MNLVCFKYLIVNKNILNFRYDHTDEVTCLDFHPKEQILVSGSKDNTIKLFDITKASVKKAYRTITVCDFYFVDTRL